MRPNLTAQDIERFWSKVDRSGGDSACWLWTGARTKAGYGRIGSRRISHNYAHRFVWELHNDPIPDGLFVCHTCDTPQCCNPSHLWLGTAADNQRDSKEKGRTATGDRNAMRLYPERRLRGDQHWTRRMPERVKRGDENGSHLHTENRPYGARNGAHTHPERRPRGETSGNAKLTSKQVQAIRTAYAAGGWTLRSLAAEFHVSKSLISVIVRNEAWRDE